LRQEVESLLNHDSQREGWIDARALDIAAQALASTPSKTWIGREVLHYQVLSLLGRGGMGEVYRARDLKLKREVAIKILPDEFARDPERVSRFRREAEVLASLNHPNIAAIYDFEEAGGLRFLVLELVDGETLADRLNRGPIPVREALGIAKDICEALEAAHEKGVVHRDLKPANVKITVDGQVKVLDFGLAKALEIAPANPALSNSPTLSMAATNAGVVLGTAAYMSPEQARGRAVDRRTDIFAFGCVLYEMLTGRPAFEGEDVTEILGRVVTGDPEWNRLPDETPVVIRRMLRRALKRDSRQRLGDIRDARLEIEEELSAPLQVISQESAASRRPWAKWIGAVAAAGVIVALAVPAARHLREPLPAEMRVEISTPATSAPGEFSLSPDGKYIAFIASGDGVQRLWLRLLAQTEPRPLAGTEGANNPFWSADSRSIGFFASTRLYRIDIAGGPPQVLANAAQGRGGTWNADGTILFSTLGSSPILRVSASGGVEPAAVTHLVVGRQAYHRYPQFLPDGRHFLYYSQGITEATGLYLGSLDGGEPKRLTAVDSQGAYMDPDMVLFVQQGTLVAKRLDLKRGELTGDPMTLANSVGSDLLNPGAFSVSHNHVAYRSGGGGLMQLTWFDRSGKAVGQAGEADSNLLFPDLSPDGRHVAVTRTVQGNMDIFLMDLLRGGSPTRFTSDPTNEVLPMWSPDGKQVVFSSNQKGNFDLYIKPANGVGVTQLLLGSKKAKAAQDWSRDGRFLLYYETDDKMGRDLWAMEMNGKERKQFAVANTPSEETMAQFSPDGHFVAYQTNESGMFQIVVQTFPTVTRKWPVSTGGGVEPRWRSDGKELYFISPDAKLMAATVKTSGTGFEAEIPVALFQTRIVGGAGASNRPQYDVSRDGRFLINQQAEQSTASPIVLILNWKPPEK
jgi:Tol biopolymer transport system component